MKNIRLIFLIFALLAIIVSHSVLARNGHSGGSGHSGGGAHSGGGSHPGGGHPAGSYGHEGSHGSHGHSHLNIGLGYYGPGFYGYGGYGGYGGFGGYGYGSYGFGGYGYGDPYYYPPYYAYPRTVIVPSTPPVYIQQQVQPVQPQTSYWYYCQEPEGYYPHVKKCPRGWLQVAPQPYAQ